MPQRGPTAWELIDTRANADIDAQHSAYFHIDQHIGWYAARLLRYGHRTSPIRLTATIGLARPRL